MAGLAGRPSRLRGRLEAECGGDTRRRERAGNSGAPECRRKNRREAGYDRCCAGTGTGCRDGAIDQGAGLALSLHESGSAVVPAAGGRREARAAVSGLGTTALAVGAERAREQRDHDRRQEHQRRAAEETRHPFHDTDRVPYRRRSNAWCIHIKCPPCGLPHRKRRKKCPDTGKSP